MKRRILILALADLSLEDADLTEALNSLKRLGVIYSFRRNCKTIRIEMDAVRAELLMESFSSSRPIHLGKQT